MVADLQLGAVLPPVVIGAVVDEQLFSSFPKSAATSIADVLSPADAQTLSIIDGMQRTAAILEAATVDSAVRDSRLRVEFVTVQVPPYASSIDGGESLGANAQAHLRRA
jgi:hypothetical protein